MTPSLLAGAQGSCLCNGANPSHSVVVRIKVNNLCRESSTVPDIEPQWKLGSRKKLLVCHVISLPYAHLYTHLSIPPHTAIFTVIQQRRWFYKITKLTGFHTHKLTNYTLEEKVCISSVKTGPQH